jgi:hypothetical protein
MKSWTYFRIILFSLLLGACSRNPLGEDLKQPILNLAFFLGQSCTNNFNQDSPYNCNITTSEVLTGVTYALDPITTTCAWATINATSGVITGTPNDDQVGVCLIAVTAQNGKKTAVPYSYSVAVANLPAIFTIANAAPILEGATATIIRNDAAVQASEEGFGTYSFDHATTTAPRCLDNSSALSIDPVTGAVTFAPANDFSGTCNIKVAFDDGNGAANSIVKAQIMIHRFSVR